MKSQGKVRRVPGNQPQRGLLSSGMLRGQGWNHGTQTGDGAPLWVPRLPPGPAEPRRKKPERAPGVARPSLWVGKGEVGLRIPFRRRWTEALGDKMICPVPCGRKGGTRMQKQVISGFSVRSFPLLASERGPIPSPLPDPQHRESLF